MLTKTYIYSQETEGRRNDLRRQYNLQQLYLSGGLKKPKNHIRTMRGKKTQKKARKGIATKSDENKWKIAKQKACSQGGLCKHSARKMQWATRWYKEHGGKYEGKKSNNNRLVKWGKEKWTTASGKKSKGKWRYLPKKAWSELTKKEINATNRAKMKGFIKGKQWVKQPKKIAEKTAKFRK